MGEKKDGNKAWREYLKHLLRNNDKALLKALDIIYKNELEATSCHGQSGWRPGAKGFNLHDRDTLMSIAESYYRCHRISEDRLLILRARLPKYWKQLKVAADEKQKLKERLQEAKHDQGSWTYNHDMKDIQMCMGEGMGCEYGICDECPALIKGRRD